MTHNRKLSAISIVNEDCQSGSQPKELKTGQDEYEWDDDGWIVYTEYYDFKTPLLTADLTEWAIQNYKEDSAFQTNGRLRLQYLCNLARSHAEYLIQKALGYEKDSEVIGVLQLALTEVNPTSKVVPTPALQQKKSEKEPDSIVEVEPEKELDINSVTEQSTVFHNRFGTGTVTQIAEGKIYVEFGGQQRIFQYPDAFDKGWLTL